MNENLIPKSWIGNANVHLPFALNIIALIVIWAICLGAIFFIWKRSKSMGSAGRWSTQDILVVAIMGVLLEVYDNLLVINSSHQ